MQDVRIPINTFSGRQPFLLLSLFPVFSVLPVVVMNRKQTVRKCSKCKVHKYDMNKIHKYLVQFKLSSSPNKKSMALRICASAMILANYVQRAIPSTVSKRALVANVFTIHKWTKKRTHRITL